MKSPKNKKKLDEYFQNFCGQMRIKNLKSKYMTLAIKKLEQISYKKKYALFYFHQKKFQKLGINFLHTVLIGGNRSFAYGYSGPGFPVRQWSSHPCRTSAHRRAAASVGSVSAHQIIRSRNRIR